MIDVLARKSIVSKARMCALSRASTSETESENESTRRAVPIPRGECNEPTSEVRCGHRPNQ